MGRFLSPDSIIPQSQGVQAWDRYAGMNNNPVRFNDPSGHSVDCAVGEPDCEGGEYIEPGNNEILDENGWDYVPGISDVRGVVRGIQTMDVASGQPGFLDQQAALQTWSNNCYGVCHGSDPITGSPSGGPMPNVPLVDTYSQGMGEAVGSAVSLLIDAAYAKATTKPWAVGGEEWHMGWQTKDEWSIIHVGNAKNPEWGGIHLAIGSVGPRNSFFHIYVYPKPHIFISWPK